MKTLTQANFAEEVLTSAGPVLVDFSAEWCGPCKKLHPIIEDLAREYDGRLSVGTVDVGREAGIAGQYGVLSLPTILLFKGGAVQERIVGLTSRDKLAQLIDRFA